jgi:hypothetical protein
VFGDDLAGLLDRGPQVALLGVEVLEAFAQGVIFVHGEWVRRTELVIATAERAEAAGRWHVAGRRLGRPARDDDVQCGLQRRRIVGHRRLARDLRIVRWSSLRGGRCGAVIGARARPDRDRDHAGLGFEPASPELAHAGKLDEELLAQCVPSEPGLEVGTIRGAQAVVGEAEALAGLRRGALRGGQSIARDRVGGAELGQLGRGSLLALDSR